MTSTFNETVRLLLALRARHGSKSRIGGLYSNLIQQLRNLPPAPDERIEYLTPDCVIAARLRLIVSIDRSKSELARLMGREERAA